jgi:molybdate transport system substrate-binding protein
MIRLSDLANRSRIFAALLVVAVSITACAPTSEPMTSPTLTVLAASSLTEAFLDLEAAFERGQPGADVTVSFAGSQSLRLQIEQGVRADVFASANPDHMQALENAGLVRAPTTFATNALVIAVPASNPSHIGAFEQLPRASRIVIGSPEVPIGRYARTLFARADSVLGGSFGSAVESRVVSHEPNVRLVLAKVELGEADAAVVYRTDLTRARTAVGISIPSEVNVEAEYRAGILSDAPNLILAQRWMTFLNGPDAQDILEHHGFSLP